MLVLCRKRTTLNLRINGEKEGLAVPYRIKRTFMVCFFGTFTIFGKDGLTVYKVKTTEWYTRIHSGEVTTTIDVEA